ncbi:hypothetical protein FK216_13145 [Moraxellaceae bacterium AER2_44_116]|nr:hypothetical protein [Moraxellaceae bacterium]TQC96012.1 hypothetical protein FK216_13145 [Moraxellaceae bacterium AER2_44_116]
MSFEVKPGIGLGSLMLGMTRNDAISAMKSISSAQPMLVNTFECSKTFLQDDYRNCGDGDEIIIAYDEHRNVDVIHIGDRFFSQLTLYGKYINDWCLDDLKKELKRRGFSVRKEFGNKVNGSHISDDAGLNFTISDGKMFGVSIFSPFMFHRKYEMYDVEFEELKGLTNEEYRAKKSRLKQEILELLVSLDERYIMYP